MLHSFDFLFINLGPILASISYLCRTQFVLQGMYSSLHMVQSSILQSIFDGNGPTVTIVFETSLVKAPSTGSRIFRKRSYSARFQKKKKRTHTQCIQIILARPHGNAKTMVGQNPSQGMRYMTYDIIVFKETSVFFLPHENDTPAFF